VRVDVVEDVPVCVGVPVPVPVPVDVDVLEGVPV
jgi:hypothetical protein